jgi:hypothetical protein
MGPFALITLLCYVIAGLHVPLRHLGIASGLIGTFRSAGGSVGNAVFNTILNSVVKGQIPKKLGEVAVTYKLSAEQLAALIPATAENAVGIPGVFASVPGITPAIEHAAAEAYSKYSEWSPSQEQRLTPFQSRPTRMRSSRCSTARFPLGLLPLSARASSRIHLNISPTTPPSTWSERRPRTALIAARASQRRDRRSTWARSLFESAYGRRWLGYADCASSWTKPWSSDSPCTNKMILSEMLDNAETPDLSGLCLPRLPRK